MILEKLLISVLSVLFAILLLACLRLLLESAK